MMDQEQLIDASGAAVMRAWQQLLQLNLESWKPEVAEWLHSEEAQPELREFLALVPCSMTIH
jgi:hypothetical protein